jgi:hypothetical protein
MTVYRPARRQRVAAATVAMLVTVLGAATGLSHASAVTNPAHHRSSPVPLPTPREGAAIEAFAPDQAQFFCRSTVEPGVKAFERRVLRQYPMSHTDGDMRACDVAGSSEHKDGRAWDWGVDHRIPTQRAAGKSMLRWLFATDAHGNQDAMFRRLGLMYIIWDKKIWGAWSQHWEPYSCSGVTACHVDHMHFSFGWAGAEGKTSYWTHQVSPVIEPPLPTLTAIHAHRALRVSAATGESTAHWLLKAGATYRVTAAGAWRHGHGANSLSDAACTKSPHGWVPSDNSVSIGGDQLHGWGLRWQPAHDNGNGCDTSHVYRLVLHQLLPSTVRVELPDSSAQPASGSINVRFERVA